MEIDIGMATSRSAQNRTDQARIESGQKTHGLDSTFTQGFQVNDLFITSKQTLVFLQRRFDLQVPRHIAGIRRTQVLGRLAFGRVKIMNTLFGHKARGFLGDAHPHLLIT
jgi:hypothetical protein